MKKITTIIAVIFLMVFATKNISAQNISAGGGLNYATDIGTIGISINGKYTINEKIQIAPSFIYYFEKDFVSWSALDVDGHYIFSNTNGFDIYGIAGLGMTFTSITIDMGPFFGGEQSYSESNFGVNLGVGASKNIAAKLDVFGEAKYTIASGGYMKIGAGVLYQF